MRNTTSYVNYNLDHYSPVEPYTFFPSRSNRFDNALIPCRDFIRNNCNKVDCIYAHVTNANSPGIIPFDKNQPVTRCSDFNYGKCHRQICRYAHIINYTGHQPQSDSPRTNDDRTSSGEAPYKKRKQNFEPTSQEGLDQGLVETNTYTHENIISSQEEVSSYKKTDSLNAIMDCLMRRPDRLGDLVQAIENREVFDFGDH